MVKIAWEARGEGQPVLMIHGLGYARWGWEPVVESLAREFRLLLFDNRGIGESEAPPGPYSARAMAEDAVAVLDEAGVERAHVVGTSLGGMVAQELALGRPERVDRLVLACTTPGGTGAFPLPEQTLRLMAEAPSLPQEVALERFVENALGPDAPRELIERIVVHRLAAPPDPAGWAAQAAAGASFDAFDRLEQIAAPTLVLHGTADSVVDARNADLLAERVPDARLELFPGAGHLFFWEQPERFVEIVGEFLSC
jgi:pimeloyl-ACP methyl ester carboxylesterase